MALAKAKRAKKATALASMMEETDLVR